MKSIMQKEKVCWVCGTDYNIHEHHIFEGSGRRKMSEKNGFKVFLCGHHHNLSDEGVHFNKELDLELKRECQMKFEETRSHEEFMAIVGRNYL
jgi:hypothetical protein